MAIPIPVSASVKWSPRNYSPSSSISPLPGLAQCSSQSYLPQPIAKARHQTKPCAPSPADPENTVLAYHLDREYWRSRSLFQETRLNQLLRRYTISQRSIAALTAQNAELQARLDAALQAKDEDDAIALENLHLLYQISELSTQLAKLRRSDRAKEKVHQNNLRLKAAMSGHKCAQKTDGDIMREQTLLEALGASNERIEELEQVGERLLDAMDGSDEEDNGGFGMGRVEAEVAFRGVLDDETFRNQKVLWEELLE